MSPVVSSLHSYPVKSLSGSAHPTLHIAPAGPLGDRRWMVVDEQGRCMTQREVPRMASVRAVEAENGLTLSGEGLDIRCAPPAGDRRREVVVWADTVDAAAVDPKIDAALSGWFGRRVHLVHMDARAHRATSADWAGEGAPVSFADGYPVLVATQASLDDLDARIAERGGEPVPMARFRANVVIAGTEPWADDAWSAIRIGDVTLDLVKPCVRCVITMTDQETGRRPTAEPLRTLATFRRSKDARVRGTLFGWNAVPRSEGRIGVGDGVEVVQRRDAWPVG